MPRLLLVTDDAFAAHDPGTRHPERPARLGAVLDGIAAVGLGSDLLHRPPRAATRAELEAVHSAEHLDDLEARCRAGGGRLDPDTVASARSWEAATLGAGSGLVAVDALLAGDADAAFCAVRPPGHHATANRAMGFCLVNNVAVTAAALAARGERVLVVDIDAHHGNGTQDLFWEDPRVLYVSLHQWPLYPGTGALDEVGGPGARGATLNVPLPPGATGDVYLAAVDQLVAPLVASEQPDWLLLSAGFDAHRADPITGLGLSAGDYAPLTERLRALVPPGRCVAFLEGGYDLEALRTSALACASALAGDARQPEPPTNGGPGRDAVAAARLVRDQLLDLG